MRVRPYDATTTTTRWSFFPTIAHMPIQLEASACTMLINEDSADPFEECDRFDPQKAARQFCLAT